MLVKNITYTDYNGDERSETYRFNLTKAEVVEMDLSTEGGMETLLKRITEERDGRELMRIFKDLILKSYGVKSDDGKRFVKNQELRDAFEQTEAYSELFMELLTDADKAADFVNNIFPKVENNISTIPAPKN